MKAREYPIRAVSRLTGLTIDTLRAWERRYKAVVPGRTKRGRVYSEQDVERFDLLRRCTEIGYSIGQIAGWDNEKLRKVLTKKEEKPELENPQAIVKQMLEALKQYDAKILETELSRIAILYPPSDLVRHIVLPFMKEVGEHWSSGRLTIAQEHLASTTLRNLLGSLLRYYLRSGAKRTLLFATPQGENHEFGILGAAMLAASGGLEILYLGTDLPSDEILNTLRLTSCKAVVLGWKGASNVQQSLDEIRKLSEHMPQKVELWVGGLDDEKLRVELKKTRAVNIPDFDSLQQHMTRLGWRG